MEILGLLSDGMSLSLQPLNIGLILIGVTLGLFIGAMPCLLYTSPSPRDKRQSRMPSSA